MSERGRALEVSAGTDVGGYTVEARLGEGGFGTVVRAWRGGQFYALKLLPLEEVGEWGVHEMLTLARVHHPHVVRLLGHGQWPDQEPRYFVVIMEYVAGRRLDVWASTDNPSARKVVQTVLGVAQALAAIHQAKVLHRDVKEANILIREATGEAVLVDFGVGSDEQTSWRPGDKLPPGTLAYRSPEQWRFAREHEHTPGAYYRSTPADDVYALGVVLYWLLTNRKPFHVENSKGVEAVLTEAPIPPHVLNPRVPVSLSELCLRLLAKEPGQRPDARELCSVLTRQMEQREEPWEVPLCTYFSEHTVTTRPGPGADEVAAWLKGKREAEAHPRRGPRPLMVLEGEAAVEAAPAQALPSATGTLAPPSAARVRRLLPHAALGLAVIAATSGAVAWVWQIPYRTAHPPPLPSLVTEVPDVAALEPTSEELWEMGWKVAPPWKPPEATSRAILVTEDTARVASSTLSTQEEASMMNPSQKKQNALGLVSKVIAAAAPCFTLACSGVPVRPEPPSEPCPPGAIKTMEELDIDLEDKALAFFRLKGDRIEAYISVREGWANLELLYGLGDLPKGAIVKGRFHFGGERVYGRFTEVQERNGTRTWPVCFDLLNTDGTRGSPLESGSTADVAKVYYSFELQAVDRFP